MSQLTIQLSDRADALVTHLQKEIFQRRRKKVSAAAVIETLVESGARSQSDKRFATSWKNLLADIDKAARLAEQHGAKPGNLSNEEWAMVLALRSRGNEDADKPAARRRQPAKASAVAAPAKSGAKERASKAPRAKAAAAEQTGNSASTAKAASKAKPVSKATAAPKAKAAPSTKAAPAAKASATTTTGRRKSATAKAGTGSSSAKVAVAKVTGAKATPRPARRARKTASAHTATTPVAQRMARAAKRLGGAAVSSASAAGSPSPNGVLSSAGA